MRHFLLFCQENEQQVRYVILEHDFPFLHWDFMFESGESLRTWRLLEQPVYEKWITAEPLADHRRAYLEYEGPVSGDRGSVKQWDRGLCQIEETGANSLRLTLEGDRLCATATLRDDGNESRIRFEPVSEKSE